MLSHTLPSLQICSSASWSFSTPSLWGGCRIGAILGSTKIWWCTIAVLPASASLMLKTLAYTFNRYRTCGADSKGLHQQCIHMLLDIRRRLICSRPSHSDLHCCPRRSGIFPLAGRYSANYQPSIPVAGRSHWYSIPMSFFSSQGGIPWLQPPFRCLL